jgi:hypothetical protein
MSARAKFRLNSFTTSMYNRYPKNENGNRDYDNPEKVEMRTLNFTPVTDDGVTENEKFWDATPSGSIQLGTVNPEAWEQFELNRDYYVDFTEADE